MEKAIAALFVLLGIFISAHGIFNTSSISSEKQDPITPQKNKMFFHNNHNSGLQLFNLLDTAVTHKVVLSASFPFFGFWEYRQKRGPGMKSIFFTGRSKLITKLNY